MNTQRLWQAQSLDAPRISLAFVRQRSSAFRRWTRFRNGYNYVAFALLAPLIVWRAWSIFSRVPLTSLALLLYLLMGIFLTIRWHKRAASREQPAELGVLDALKFHRLQLERQRDARLDIWRRWPVIPGILILFAALLIEVRPAPWKMIGLSLVWTMLVLSIGTWFEVRIARRLQLEIDALDSL